MGAQLFGEIVVRVSEELGVRSEARKDTGVFGEIVVRVSEELGVRSEALV